MTDIEKARRLFQDKGLAFPTIPEQFAGQLKERGQWVFSTRSMEVSPYNLGYYVREVDQTGVEDYAVLSHSGHGVNSYAIQYYLVHGYLRIFLHLGWGGMYMNKKYAETTIHECFSIADRLVRAAQSVGSFHAGEHLTVVGSTFYGSYWLTPGKTRTWAFCVDVENSEALPSTILLAASDRKDFLFAAPQGVLTEALGWLTSRGGAGAQGEGTTTPIPCI
jgi:hypothetical protein